MTNWKHPVSFTPPLGNNRRANRTGWPVPSPGSSGIGPQYTVKPGLVSAVKYGKKNRKRSARLPSVRVAARRTANNGSITVEQLIEVKKLADSIGGAEQVRSALDALEQLR